MLERREFMRTCAGVGLAGTLFPGVLWAQAHAEGGTKITKDMIDSAAAIAGVSIADDFKEMILSNLNRGVQHYEELRKVPITNAVEPAFVFDPMLPGMRFDTASKPLRMSRASGRFAVPANLEDLAF